jgi:hypothetical protein
MNSIRKVSDSHCNGIEGDLDENFPPLSSNKPTTFPPTPTVARSYKDIALTYTFVPKDKFGNPLSRGMYKEICRGCGQLCYGFCDNDWCDGRTPSPQTIEAELEMEKNKREIETMKRWEEDRRRNANTPPTTTR